MVSSRQLFTPLLIGSGVGRYRPVVAGSLVSMKLLCFCLATLAPSTLSRAAVTTDQVRYHVLDPVAPSLPLPKDKRIPVGWPAFALGADPVHLDLKTPGNPSGPAWLRVTTALDDRQPRIIEVILGHGERLLGRLDLRFAHAIETFQLFLPTERVQEVRARGLTLRLVGEGPPMWFFGRSRQGRLASSGDQNDEFPVEFQPHLMTAGARADRVAEFHRRFASLASLQPFGWMEGCVLEGLRMLEARVPGGAYARARDLHWRQFVPAPDRMIYEDPTSRPADDRVYGTEGGLPFADLAWRDASSPLLGRFVAFAKQHPKPDGAIRGNSLTTEGSYTIAYPLAVIAFVRNQPDLALMAHRQLQLRGERLWHDGAIWHRQVADGNRAYRGWSRGVAWHLLGLARSIAPLRLHLATADLEVDFQRVANWLLPLQRDDGLWSCFVEDPATPPDTSGSAGIAAALAWGARSGVLAPPAGDAARRALTAIMTHLTPDGLLDGVAQSNRGGETLQRGDYRVLSQMGMGLLAQLMAECNEVLPPPH